VRAFQLLIAVLALSGCRSDLFAPEEGEVEGDGGSITESSYALVFTLERYDSTAGESVPYLAYIDGGSEPIAVDPVLSSDLEALLSYGDGSVSATVAGAHALTATADHEGLSYLATVDLDVDPGPPSSLDLELADVQVEAGAELGYEVLAWDVYDNPTSPEGTDISVDSEAVTDSGAAFRTTQPGTYTATATLVDDESTLVDDEAFIVVAGPPSTLDLWLEDEALELDESTIAHVDVFDQFGNAIDEDFVLWTDPADAVDWANTVLTVAQEGYLTVWAQSEDASLTDSVGPLLIDSTGPETDIDLPERGTRTEEEGAYAQGTVSDAYSGVAEVTVNGEAASIDELGNWESWVDYEFGTNLVDIVAEDGEGNETSETIAVMSGDYTPYGDGVGDALMVRIYEPGFETIEDLASGFLTVDVLQDAIGSDALISESSETCWDILGWEECFTWYSLYFYIQDPYFSSTELTLDPKTGYIDAGAQIHDFYLGMYAYGEAAEIDYSLSASLDIDTIDISMDLTPSVSGGQLDIAVSNINVDLQGFDLDQTLYDVVDAVFEFFGFDLDDYMASLVEDLVASEIESAIPDLLDSTLSELVISTDFDINGVLYDFEALPYSVSVDEAGLSLGLETYFMADAWLANAEQAPGSLTYPYTAPSYGSSTSDMALGLSQDFINQALFAIWGGGVLEMAMDSSELGLDLGDFSLFMPELSSLSIGTYAYLPPVVVPGTDGNLLELQLGDLELSLYNGEVDEANLWMRIYVSVFADMALEATEDNTLLAGLGDMEIVFDLDYPDDRSVYAEDTEVLLEALVPLLLPSLTDALGEIPIPNLDGFSLEIVDIGLAGAEDGYVEMEGGFEISL